MFTKLFVCVLVSALTVDAFRFATGYKYSTAVQTSNKFSSSSCRRMVTLMSEVSTNNKKKSAPKDLSGFTVGQTVEGKVQSVRPFGAFVEVAGGANILLPRSLLSRGSFAKLTRMASIKSKDIVHVELLAVNQENQTLSGKYITGVSTLDLSSYEEKDYVGKNYNATVCGVHDFGVFAELDDFGVEGLIPSSRLPVTLPGNSVEASFPVGSTVSVQIESMNLANKKLTLTMKNSDGALAGEAGSGEELAGFPPSKWVQGFVTNVASFGIFVRPAGQDAIGLVHFSRIPGQLMGALKKQSPINKELNKTDVEQLFSVGDVVKCRVNSYVAATKKLELTMLPPKSSDDGDDDYIVEGRDPEGEEDTPVVDDGADEEYFDPESTLLWWRGKPYSKIGGDDEDSTELDASVAVVNENVAVVEGTWRRLFELDMREDAADFSSKIMEAELKELEEEIGELGGLDDDMVDTLGFGTGVEYKTKSFGSSVSVDLIPDEWKAQMEFFKEKTSIETERKTKLKGGKKADQAEFESLLREVEAELEQAATRRGSRQSEPAFDPEAAPAPVEVSASSVPPDTADNA